MKRFRKELKELAILGGIVGVLYITGLHTEVAAFAQRAILATGLITADTDAQIKDNKASYDLAIEDMEGNIYSLEHFKNKVIFMNQWASWCAPCIAEMPSIQNLFEKIETEDIVFIMLSLDADRAKAKQFIVRKGYTFPVYFPAGNIPAVYRSQVIPTTYVISKKGEIVSKKVGMADYNRKSFYNFLLKQAE